MVQGFRLKILKMHWGGFCFAHGHVNMWKYRQQTHTQTFQICVSWGIYRRYMAMPFQLIPQQIE